MQGEWESTHGLTGVFGEPVAGDFSAQCDHGAVVKTTVKAQQLRVAGLGKPHCLLTPLLKTVLACRATEPADQVVAC
ncbi:hypothetical protein NNJEOMEG_03072 [Fundidesulfovibrio magnetotacticus]|uniref:Uncharacterized protein n=1 Tax=Fundidesulfovibrio magnetotacticus TaxID=2730080 RepID=A0A6V8LU12_9BACT|nr:hypothetical protein [Fundidesulfovibrio magnetotacticus]GFK95214.1 hypothetical protein NNJEOMEG_03072 [Fundidesulfovibrio magnetotacticus]